MSANNKCVCFFIWQRAANARADIYLRPILWVGAGATVKAMIRIRFRVMVGVRVRIRVGN